MSTLLTVLLVALGAAVGAPLRYVLALALDARFPTGMLLVNTLGSGLFGVFAALSLGDAGWALLGTGFCGAFTSFSTFAVQSVERSARAATAYVLATTVLAVGACALGWMLATRLDGVG
ncbi:CrcB family protein [Nocardioides sp.]|uniref:fluoride efflux transporter FluC n=1 Tax=Nocardioides sp. TaxID=35761 RepID=UPI00261CB6DF|nr:CrcB family protein [Nocardioides sp.]MCW2736735.1 crcB 2 [Nocardioides sp.]